MGAQSRAKGAAAEQEVKILLRSILAPVYGFYGMDPPDLKRNLEQSRSGGSDLVGLAWAAIEVKRHEKEQLAAWWKQCVAAAAPGQIPILLWRANRSAWRARIRATVVTSGHPSLSLTLDLERPAFEEWLRYEAWGRLSALHTP